MIFNKEINYLCYKLTAQMKITKNFLNSFIKNVIDKPEGFIMLNEARSAQALKATKELYDLGRYTIIIFEVVGFLPLTSFFSS